MQLMRKYSLYKRALQVLLSINAFLIFLGAVAGYHYLQDHELSSLELFLVGLGVLFFGVALPAYFIFRIEQQIQKLRQSVFAQITRLVGLWIDHKTSEDSSPWRNPTFWLQMGLLAFEEFGAEIDHPLVSIFLEFSPQLRKELHKQRKQTQNPD